MPLIKSISGIRGTIGGHVENALTPVDIVALVSSYAQRLRMTMNPLRVLVGRDGRISGDAIHALVIGTLRMSGVDVVDAGLSTTPTVAYMVSISPEIRGGLILTASHNPREWNALKLLNEEGEFISEEDGKAINDLIAEKKLCFPTVDNLGAYTKDDNAIEKHIQAIVEYPLVDVESIKKKKFRVVADVINSTGALTLPILFDKLGVEYVLLNEEINGDFQHNPEPLPEHLTTLQKAVKNEKADLGIAVDPDVDRLCFVCEDGSMFGEEYTLVAVADYILQHRKGNTVSNLSSSNALSDVSKKHHVNYAASKVGEAHVVAKMKQMQAIIGGEGNGGIIIPDFHYGRDALIGIGLFLSFMASELASALEIRNRYPFYHMVKDKITLGESCDKEKLFHTIKKEFEQYTINDEDGLKIWINDSSWVQLRASNTEPIIRIFSEANSEYECKKYIDSIKEHILKFI